MNEIKQIESNYSTNASFIKKLCRNINPIGLFTNFLDLIAPPVCFVCQKKIENLNNCLCYNCSSKLKRNYDPYYLKKELGDIYINNVFYLYYYDHILRELIHYFKYREVKVVGNFFAYKAANIIKTEYPYLLEVDGIVSVPMHPTRRRERIYNHAVLFASKLSQLLNIYDYSHTIVKTKNTTKQSLSIFEDRFIKPRNTFKVKNDYDFTGKTLMLVDDVFTTGATANELAKILKKNGAKIVHVFTIASGHTDYKSTSKKNNNSKRIYR